MVCLVAMVLLLCYIGYTSLDDQGLMTHDKNVDVYMKGDWLVGENRTCAGIQTFGDAQHPKEMAELFCPVDAEDKNPHNLKVRFWGKISRPDASASDEVNGLKGAWRCTRESDIFTCRAIN